MSYYSTLSHTTLDLDSRLVHDLFSLLGAKYALRDKRIFIRGFFRMRSADIFGFNLFLRTQKQIS